MIVIVPLMKAPPPTGRWRICVQDPCDSPLISSNWRIKVKKCDGLNERSEHEVVIDGRKSGHLSPDRCAP